MEKLRHIEMPQNGIKFHGIQALTEAISESLVVLNLSDNIMTIEGGRVMADALAKAKNLKVLNFSDCLLKGKGFLLILKSLKKSGCLKNLQTMNFQGNEIGGNNVVNLLVDIFKDSSENYHHHSLDLSCNEFGESNREYLLDELQDKMTLKIE